MRSSSPLNTIRGLGWGWVGVGWGGVCWIACMSKQATKPNHTLWIACMSKQATKPNQTKPTRIPTLTPVLRHRRLLPQRVRRRQLLPGVEGRVGHHKHLVAVFDLVNGGEFGPPVEPKRRPGGVLLCQVAESKLGVVCWSVGGRMICGVVRVAGAKIGGRGSSESGFVTRTQLLRSRPGAREAPPSPGRPQHLQTLDPWRRDRRRGLTSDPIWLRPAIRVD